MIDSKAQIPYEGVTVQKDDLTPRYSLCALRASCVRKPSNGRTPPTFRLVS